MLPRRRRVRRSSRRVTLPRLQRECAWAEYEIPTLTEAPASVNRIRASIFAPFPDSGAIGTWPRRTWSIGQEVVPRMGCWKGSAAPRVHSRNPARHGPTIFFIIRAENFFPCRFLVEFHKESDSCHRAQENHQYTETCVPENDP